MTQQDISFYGLWIQTVAIVVSAIGIIVIVSWNVRIARRRATLDLLISEQTNETTITERTTLTRLRHSDDILQWISPEKMASTELNAIRATLNRYELVAIGIKEHALDGEIYKRWCRTELVKDWTSFKPLITEIRRRTKNKRHYCEFENLAGEWAEGDERNHI
jgi:hypothetical protein